MYVVEPSLCYEVSEGRRARPELGGTGLGAGALPVFSAIFHVHKEAVDRGPGANRAVTATRTSAARRG